MIAIPAWIEDNASQYRPTEILIPVEYGIGPVWSYQDDRGGWFARIRAILPLTFEQSALDGDLMACNHVHPTEDEAWKCADGLAITMAIALTGVGPERTEHE